MRTVADLETPAVLVDVDVALANVRRMAERARAAGVKLRPHAKTHKLPEIARFQLDAGARGLTLAKTGEAETFADRGFDDLFLAYPIVGADKARRLVTLSDRVRRLAVGADSVAGARTLSDAFRAAGRTLDVMIKVDSGLHRVGVAPEEAPELAMRLAELPGIAVRGVFTHAGHAYAGPTSKQVAEMGRAEGEILAAAAEEIRRAGVPLEEVSVGSTPTAPFAMRVAGVTECRPGNYVYHDASQVALGTCSLTDCALTVLATVISVPAPERPVLDSGSKTLSSDPLRPSGGGFGWILGRRAYVERLSEEHGALHAEPGESFRVGERVRVLPNHACVVSNLHDRVFAVRGDRIEAEWRVAARGLVT